MTVNKRDFNDIFENIIDKHRHIDTLGQLLLDGCEPPASRVGSLLSELAEDADKLANELLEMWKGGAS